MGVDVEWPDALLDAAEWFRGFNLGIDLIAPECLADAYNWHIVFGIGGVVLPFGALGLCWLRYRQIKRGWERIIERIDHEGNLETRGGCLKTFGDSLGGASYKTKDVITTLQLQYVP